MKRFGGLACVAACAMVALAGCSTLSVMRGERKVKAEYYPDGKDMIIIPFSDPAFEYYFESPEGALIAAQVGGYIRANKITPVRYGRMLSPMARTLYSQHKDNPRAAWEAIAAALDADLILVGEIEKLETGDPKQPNLSTGLLQYSVRLIDVTDEGGGRVVWFKDHERIVYPEGRAWDLGVDVPDDKLIRYLLLRAGERIGKAFHDHMEPIARVGTRD